MAKLRAVALAGGTHGNELTGAYVVKNAQWLFRHWQHSFSITPFLANPAAFQIVRRYVDQDLNRCFGPAAPQAPTTVEQHRAREIIDQYRTMDFIIDLHTTTSYMGNTLILSRPDPVSLQIAFAVKQRLKDLKLIIWGINTAEPPILSSLLPGFTHEIGPVAQGLLDPDIFQQTLATLETVFDCIDQYNNDQLPAIDSEQVYVHHGPDYDFPRDEEGSLTGYIHRDFLHRNFEPLKKGDPLFTRFDGTEITYDGEEGLCPLFINEAAYYEKGIAFTLVKEQRWTRTDQPGFLTSDRREGGISG